ncbi:hypothetical protein [endosymbiont of unidentified scaly snail isolate Monju]|uniref:hypothetical protein n=1 Tax=endosymbiont of unidentified scaly snail isolate Monju TaxID=1248727 RepID=UPI000689A834|nr:hypothetical protein [endosymbiont of unidentified scaly snail isolate Monju]
MKTRSLMLAMALLPAIALTGCQTAETKEAAAALKNEWRDTAKIIKAAEKAAAKGDYATAIKLANKAEEQGRLAVQQARDNANAGNPSYLY